MSIDNALLLAMRNKSQLASASKAGCYQCGAIFDPKEITEYTDQGDTAVCPKCSEDAVIPESVTLKITTDYLKSVKEFWTGN